MQGDSEKYKDLRDYAQRYFKAQEVTEKTVKVVKKKLTKWQRFVYICSLVLYWFRGSKTDWYEKPAITKLDVFFLLINIHVNFRSMVGFVDRTLSNGPYFVSITYALIHCIVCPSLCYLYGFLGRYGERSFLTIWQLCPIFEGISVCAGLLECLKMIETMIYASTMVIMLINRYYNDAYMFTGESLASRLDAGTLQCNTSSKKPLGIDYGLSRIFTDMGNNPGATSWLDMRRVIIVIGLWTTILLLRLIRCHTVTLILKRIITGFLFAGLLITVGYGLIGSLMIKGEPDKPSFYIYDIVRMVAFAIAEYMPTHWITLGFIQHSCLSQTQIIGTVLLSTAIGITLSWSLEIYLSVYADIINIDRACITTYGIEFFLVIIPYKMRSEEPAIAFTLIRICVLIAFISCISYVSTHHVLFHWAFESYNTFFYRYRHMMISCSTLILLTLTLPFCTYTCHALMIQLHDVVFYHVQIILFAATLAAMSIYGWWHLSADSQFREGVEYETTSLKLISIFAMITFISYSLSLFHDYKTVGSAHILVLVSLCVIILPLPLGVIINICLCKRHHKLLFRPLPTWGGKDEAKRDERRLYNMRRMLVTQTVRECGHNCLRSNGALEADIIHEQHIRHLLLDILATGWVERRDSDSLLSLTSAIPSTLDSDFLAVGPKCRECKLAVRRRLELMQDINMKGTKKVTSEIPSTLDSDFLADEDINKKGKKKKQKKKKQKKKKQKKKKEKDKREDTNISDL